MELGTQDAYQASTPVKGSRRKQDQAEEKVELHRPGKASFYPKGKLWKENCPSGCRMEPVTPRGCPGKGLAWGEAALSMEQLHGAACWPVSVVGQQEDVWVARLLISQRWTCGSL